MRSSSSAAALLALALAVQGCAARAAAPASAPAPAPSPVERLRADLDAIFNAQPLAHVQWGVAFHSLRQGPLYALNAARFMVPASNQKILTAAVAAERLGWGFRYTTRLLATGPIGPDGRLEGDLVVTSDGDPTINPRHPERWRAFDDWAAALKARGLRHVDGRLVGDDDRFAEPGWGVGWAWDNLQYGYGAPPSALQYHENQVEVIVGPGMRPGAPAIIATSPIGGALVIHNQVVTLDAGAEASVDLQRIPGTPHLTIRGGIALGGRPVTVLASVDNPTRFYLYALQEALSRHGITIAGGIVDIDDFPSRPPLDGARELLVDRSPSLSEIVDVTMKWSRNIYAETLLLSTAPADEPAAGARALEAMRETLQGWGVSDDAYLPRDGSGLSRYDYVSADAIVRLLTHMWNDPRHRAVFEDTFPVAGVSGTLATRMIGTPAQGRVRAKTGTLSNVRALSGYATTLDGDIVIFSMLANNFRLRAAEIDAVMEAALNRVIAGADNSRRQISQKSAQSALAFVSVKSVKSVCRSCGQNP